MTAGAKGAAQVMTGTADVLDYLDLQGTTDMITKTELKQYVRHCGGQISDRNVTYYASVGLIPPAVRIGARGGAYPKIVGELLAWVVRSRDFGLSIDAIKELLPLWRLLIRGRRSGCIDLAEFEYVAREQVKLSEANRAVPLLFFDLVTGLCDECRAKLSWLLKDGSSLEATPDPLTLSFILAELDPDTGDGRQVAWTQLQLPGLGGPDADDPRTIVLGIPNAVRLRHHTESCVDAPSRRDSLDAAPDQEVPCLN